MKTKNHDGFEPDIHPAFDCEVDMKIREFAKWVSEKLPGHVSAFILMVDREGYQTTPIVSHPVSGWDEGVSDRTVESRTQGPT